ncbi:hypothetical protein FJZ53_07045 [Candidatus Woesearchaeota archaeon]|nr:hypothetical protein [Candidatus Woesearchaeota archaeon]
MASKILKIIVLSTLIDAALIGVGVKALNSYYNNSSIKSEKPMIQVTRRDTGILSYREYIKFTDGSEEVSDYPGIFSVSDKITYYNSGKDSLVDKIKEEGWQYLSNTRFTKILEREKDYATNAEKFDKADRVLAEEKVSANHE